MLENVRNTVWRTAARYLLPSDVLRIMSFRARRRRRRGKQRIERMFTFHRRARNRPGGVLKESTFRQLIHRLASLAVKGREKERR